MAELSFYQCGFTLAVVNHYLHGCVAMYELGAVFYRDRTICETPQSYFELPTEIQQEFSNLQSDHQSQWNSSRSFSGGGILCIENPIVQWQSITAGTR